MASLPGLKDTQYIVLFYYSQLATVQCEIRADVFTHQDRIADLNHQRPDLAVIKQSPRPNGNNYRPHRLFLRLLRYDDAARGLILLPDLFYDDSVVNRFHNITITKTANARNVSPNIIKIFSIKFLNPSADQNI